MKETPRYIIDYLFGFTVFIVLIPYGFFKISHWDALFGEKILISNDTIRYTLVAVLMLTGIVFSIWSNIFLYAVGKGGPADAFGISISPQTKKLVTTGPYKYTRNPMVFGAFSAYASLVVLFNSIAGLITLILFIALIILLLKFPEEKRLEKDFGTEYLEYKKRVPMIFPFKILKNKNKRHKH